MAIRPQCAKIAMSFYKEASYGNAVASANINKAYEPNEPVLLDLTQTRIDDAATIKGHEFPVDTGLDIVTAQDIQIPFSFPSSYSVLGCLLSLVAGADSANNNNGVITHTFKAKDLCGANNDQMPSSSWMLGLVGDNNSFLLAKGVVLNELKLTLDTPSRLTVSGTAFTDGSLSSNNAYSWNATSAHGSNDWALGTQGNWSYGGNNKKSVLRGFDFIWTNALDLADARSNVVNSGKLCTSMRPGARTFSLVVRVEGHQWDEFYQDFYNETARAVSVQVTKDANRSLTIDIPTAKIITCKPSFDGIRDVLELTFKPFWNAANNSPVIVTLKNGDPAYLQ